MKKTLVALAALATVGAAFAQSTVTLYGRIDWAVLNQTQKTGGVKTGSGLLAGNVGMRVNTAGLTGSRWGMRGSEDLGGGLKAIFTLENGFNADDGFLTGGSQGGRLFGRQAYAGLQGNWGTFTAGRQYIPLDNVWSGYIDAQGGSTNSALQYAWGGPGALITGIHGDGARMDNSLDYKTPAMGGFMGEIMFAPSENKNPAIGRGAGNYVAGLVGYANGPLTAHLVYERTRTTAGTAAVPAGTVTILAAGGVPTLVATPAVAATAPTSATVRDWTVGASYNFGMAKLFGGYQRADNSANMQDKGWALGVNVPISSMSLVLSYARETQDGNTAVDGKSSAFAGQLVYPLSKRTSVNAHFRSGKKRLPGAVMLATTKNEMYGVGFRHDF